MRHRRSAIKASLKGLAPGPDKLGRGAATKSTLLAARRGNRKSGIQPRACERHNNQGVTIFQKQPGPHHIKGGGGRLAHHGGANGSSAAVSPALSTSRTCSSCSIPS